MLTAPIPHGGALAEAMVRYGGSRADWLDLSTGINPWAYPVPELDAAAWQRLPEQSAVDALERAAREAYGVHDRHAIVAAPGTQALIQALPIAIARANVSIVAPTYGEHEFVWRAHGHTVRRVREPEGADVLVIVNPNNPDGRDWSADRLENHARKLLIVDEAFRDPSPGRSLAQAPGDRIVVLRSFGKFFGLAGLRLGFAVGGAGPVERLRELLGPWSVSGPACHIGRVALEDGAWQRATRTQLRAASERLAAFLTDHGFAVVGGTELFVTAERSGAPSIRERLCRARILVRAFDYEPGWLRFGLPPDDAAYRRLSIALRSDG